MICLLNDWNRKRKNNYPFIGQIKKLTQGGGAGVGYPATLSVWIGGTDKTLRKMRTIIIDWSILWGWTTFLVMNL